MRKIVPAWIKIDTTTIGPHLMKAWVRLVVIPMYMKAPYAFSEQVTQMASSSSSSFVDPFSAFLSSMVTPPESARDSHSFPDPISCNTQLHCTRACISFLTRKRAWMHWNDAHRLWQNPQCRAKKDKHTTSTPGHSHLVSRHRGICSSDFGPAQRGMTPQND